MDFSILKFISQKFFINTKVLNVVEINSGLINKTYIIEHLYCGIKSKFILQSLSNVFDSHEILIENHQLVAEHISEKIKNKFFSFKEKRWEVPNLIRCKSNNLFTFAYESNLWRAMSYIDHTFNLEFLEDDEIAYQTGVGLSKFHMICSDLDCSKLQVGIKNFHNTNYYIDQYRLTIKDYNFDKLEFNIKQRVYDLIFFLSKQLEYVESLLKFLSNKRLEKNIIHGDPKLNNFLFDIHLKYVVSLIDLDTISIGCLHTDLADCLRSICNTVGEDPINKDEVYFDIGICMNFLRGYFSINKADISCNFNLLPEFIYIIIFELTIRFLTDFLQSNKVFKINYETHNLFRAEVQYLLLSSFISQISNLSNELELIGIFPRSAFVLDVQKFV